jgi:hypothetical protein
MDGGLFHIFPDFDKGPDNRVVQHSTGGTHKAAENIRGL